MLRLFLPGAGCREPFSTIILRAWCSWLLSLPRNAGNSDWANQAICRSEGAINFGHIRYSVPLLRNVRWIIRCCRLVQAPVRLTLQNSADGNGGNRNYDGNRNIDNDVAPSNAQQLRLSRRQRLPEEGRQWRHLSPLQLRRRSRSNFAPMLSREA
jgi:hypothetical protein